MFRRIFFSGIIHYIIYLGKQQQQLRNVDVLHKPHHQRQTKHVASHLTKSVPICSNQYVTFPD